jgi:hypothetical protein
MPISPLTKRQLTQQRTAASFPCLIEITYTDWFSNQERILHYTNASEDITFEGDIYNAAAFSIQPPDRDGSTIGDATLTISAVDQAWPEKIRGTQKPAKLRFIAVIVYQEGSIAGIELLEENSFTLRAASWNETSVSWAMHFDENMAVIVPAEKCNAQTTPGIS